MSRRSAILAAYFVLGAYAVCAQATLLREAQVLVLGSELSWGLVLAFWLVGVAVGATISGRGHPASRPSAALGKFAAAGLLIPLALLAVVIFLRCVRSTLGVGPGEYVGPGTMFWVTLLATAPVSVWVGLAFPAASALVALPHGPTAEKARAVGWVYLTESAGALAGGVLFSFVLVGRVGAVAMAMGGGILLALAVAWVIRCSGGPRWAAVLAVVLAILPSGYLASGLAHRTETATVRARWSSFAQGLDFVASADTRYQNVAIGRLADQFSLYSSGIVSATWPNPTDAAVEAHLAACEAPRPERILVLGGGGGGAEGIITELLRHRPARIDLVTLDEKCFDLVRPYRTAPDGRALEDPAVRIHFADARRFVKRAPAQGDRYDLVILAAAEPASALQARLYTEEFFAELSRAMSDDGVLAFSLSGSVGYWGPEAAHYVGSIVRPMERVFPNTLLAFGYPTHCYAARRAGVLTDSGTALAARYRARGVRSPHFDPIWFEGASDLLDARKRAGLRRALAAYPPAIENTDEHPAAALYHMRFWLKTSEAAHPRADRPATQRWDAFGALARLRIDWVLGAALAATLLAASWGLVRGRRGFRRAAVRWSVGTTGFASIAVEIILLYTFQTLYGYVYGMVGLVIGVFMAGLVLGSYLMNRRLARTGTDFCRQPGLRTLVALDLAIAVFAALLVLVLAVLRASAADWPVQAATFLLVAISGMLGGLVFPLAAAVAMEERSGVARAAGAIAAADYVGACLGALATGVLLVPILGVSGACLAVAAVKGLSALFVGAAATWWPETSAQPSASA